MGIFLVFFPEDQNSPSSLTSPFKSPTINSFLKRTNSTHIFTRTQSTISICAILIFLTLVLFTLSSFEPNNDNDFISHHRRFLTSDNINKGHVTSTNPPALQGLGTLYTRGTTHMSNLVICHVSDHVTTKELRIFLRGFHRSGLCSKADLVFIFNSFKSMDTLDEIIREENERFFKLVKTSDPVSFNVTRFVETGKDLDKGEPIWGKKMRVDNSTSELTRTSYEYGSVVGFGISEFDPENSLSGFMDSVPMSLRRWASYPMILGRVRRKFKHVILADVKEILLLGDPLTRVKSHSPESIFLSVSQKLNKKHKKIINPGLIIGGERGVRRLSAAMLTEIVRSTTRTHHNKKSALTESSLLSQLAGNEFLQKSIKFGMTELIQEPSSLSGVEIANLTVVKSGNSNLDIGEIFMKHICSFSTEASVYVDC